MLLEDPGFRDGHIGGITNVTDFHINWIDFVVTGDVGRKDLGEIGDDMADKARLTIRGVQPAKKSKDGEQVFVAQPLHK